MIIGNLSDTASIEKIHPYFKIAFSWLRENYETIHEQEEEKIILIPQDLFINVQEVAMKEPTEQFVETHKKYIDIHVPVNKNESIGWVHTSKLPSPVTPYDDNTDMARYCVIPSCFVSVNPGNFCIMFPSDGHAPLIGDGKIKKLCVKIKVIAE